jgi:hypothetical protein
MTTGKLTRPSIRPVIAGLTVVVTLLFASVPVASAHLGHSGTPGHLPGNRSASHHHHGAPGHGGHPGAPGW